MFEFQSVLFQGDGLLEAIADDAPAPGGGLTRISRTQNRRDPAVGKVQLALLDWRPGSLPLHGPDGDYGDETAGLVRTFKIEELGVAPAAVIDDVGPLTVQRLDAIRAAAEAPPIAAATVAVVNQYGESLSGVLVSADDGSVAATDEQGVAQLALAGPSLLTLDPGSALAALGDLLDRPADGVEQGTAIVVTPAALASTSFPLGASERLDVIVVARMDVEAELLAPLEGAPRTEGAGARVTIEGRTARLALQAGDGAMASVVLDPPPPSVEAPAELPTLSAWVPPDGYVVQEGDTEAGLGERFLGDPDGFSALSDHPPVLGETLTLPPEAVPGWVASAVAPLPDPPAPQTWLTVVPDELLAVLYEGADPQPLHELERALQAPPPADEDPLDVLAARADALLAFLSLGPQAGVGEQEPVDTELETAEG
ncbi:MAG TPA: hypothetical protein VKB03_12685 [Conexibacter sp.]|nr:hypothetical protein [Conexibacter sp.]